MTAAGRLATGHDLLPHAVQPGMAAPVRQAPANTSQGPPSRPNPSPRHSSAAPRPPLKPPCPAHLQLRILPGRHHAPHWPHRQQLVRRRRRLVILDRPAQQRGAAAAALPRGAGHREQQRAGPLVAQQHHLVRDGGGVQLHKVGKQAARGLLRRLRRLGVGLRCRRVFALGACCRRRALLEQAAAHGALLGLVCDGQVDLKHGIHRLVVCSGTRGVG